MAPREMLPGIFHWSAVHPEIRVPVHCHYLAPQRMLLDPLVPAEGLELFERLGPPRHVLLTNRLHSRETARFALRFGCEIWCNAAGLDHFGPDGELPGLEVRGFAAGEILPGGVRSLEIGELCPDETAFWIGDAPEAIKRALREAYRRLLQLDFDHLLFAHGEPWLGGGRRALAAFAAERAAACSRSERHVWNRSAGPILVVSTS